MFGMFENRKQIFRIGNQVYELTEVEGEICRGNRRFPAQFDHEKGLLKVSTLVPIEQRAWVVAVAISDACLQVWKPIPVIWPQWLTDAPPACGQPPPDPADDPPDR